MKYLFYILFFCTLTNCAADVNKNENKISNQDNPEINKSDETFDKELIDDLYSNLKSNFEIGFKKSDLESVLFNLNLERIKKGEEFEKEMFFEDFKCECLDKIKISYSKKDDRYILWIYEELYEEGMDWCPESSYSYSFQLLQHKIKDLKLDFMAG